MAPATATCAAGRSSSSSPKTKISSSSLVPSAAILTTVAPAAPAASAPAAGADGWPASGSSGTSWPSGLSSSAGQVAGQIVGRLGDVVAEAASSRSSSASAACSSASSGQVAESSSVAIVQIRVGVEIRLVEIHRGQAVGDPGFRSALARSSEPCSSESGTTRPRSRLNRLILDGPGSLVRGPGALPRCGIGSAHDHGHPFLRWVDATPD